MHKVGINFSECFASGKLIYETKFRQCLAFLLYTHFSCKTSTISNSGLISLQPINSKATDTSRLICFYQHGQIYRFPLVLA